MTFATMQDLETWLTAVYESEETLHSDTNIENIRIGFHVNHYDELNKMITSYKQIFGNFSEPNPSEILFRTPRLPHVLFTIAPKEHNFNKNVRISSTGQLKASTYLQNGILCNGRYKLVRKHDSNPNAFDGDIARKGDLVGLVVYPFPTEVFSTQDDFFKRYKIVKKYK